MKCALCENEYPKLCQSHLIPKLVYKRIRLHPKSRFRNLSEVNRPLQDGEKHYMLCSACEERFSKLETWFADDFLDEYLNTGKIPYKSNKDLLNRYIYSVSWRILNDDLYRMNSFCDQWARTIFENIELTLRDYLYKEKNTPPARFKNYIFSLGSLNISKDIIEISKSFLFGYSCYYIKHNQFIVITYYAGLLFITSYSPKKFLFFNRSNNVKKIARKEFLDQIMSYSKTYNENVTPELLNKIDEFYKK